MLADTPERVDWLKMSHARGRYLGMETELISVAEAKELLPIMEEKYFVGAMYDAHEGHVDPSGVTNAYAKAARQAGAEVYRHTWAHDITRAADDGWDVHVGRTRSDNRPRSAKRLGSIHCEHVVNAGGLWAREVGRMVGLELPVLAMEHMYLLTEDIPRSPSTTQNNGEMLHAIDFGGEIYMRQEGGGLLLGTYERSGKPWSPKTTPWDFGMRSLDPTSTASPSRSTSASNTSRSSPRRASSRSSTARSPSRPTATRCSARSVACPVTGSPARSWPASPRAAASDWRWPTG